MFNWFNKKMEITYGYDDVTLIPQYSDLKSRSETNISMFGYDLPIIGSCMSTLGIEMMQQLIKKNIPFVCHRAFKNAQQQFNYFFPNGMNKFNEKQLNCVWFAVGSSQKYQQWIDYLYKKGVRRFCIDMAHGDSQPCVNTIKYIKKLFESDDNVSIKQNKHIMAGNVASVSGFKRLQKAGADAIRVGIASGQICFVKGTLVSCFDEETNIFYKKPIEQVQVGQFVLCRYGLIRKVTKKYTNYYNGQIYIINNNNDKIKCTPTHKFMCYNKEKNNYEFVPIKDVNLYNTIPIDADENIVSNCYIDIEQFDGQVYNIEVEETHNYCVGETRFVVSNCSTAKQTGFGVPILTNIMNIAKYKKNTWLIADGGCKETGNIAKAIYFGADFVMIGKMLASTDLGTGACFNKDKQKLIYKKQIVNLQDNFSCVYPDQLQTKFDLAKKLDWQNHNADNKFKNMCLKNVVFYKTYYGMSSRLARNGVLSYNSVEGVMGLTSYQCRTWQFVRDTSLRLHSSLSYGGSRNWNQFRKKVKACMRSNAGIIAADTHLEVTFDK